MALFRGSRVGFSGRKFLVLKREHVRRTAQGPTLAGSPFPLTRTEGKRMRAVFEDLQQERQKQPKETMPTSLLFPCASIFLTECLSVCYRVTHFPIFSFAVVFPPSNGPFVSAKPARTPFPSHLALRFLFFHHLSQDLWLPGSDVPSTTTTTTTPESTTKKETRHPRLVPSSSRTPPANTNRHPQIARPLTAMLCPVHKSETTASFAGHERRGSESSLTTDDREPGRAKMGRDIFIPSDPRVACFPARPSRHPPGSPTKVSRLRSY